LFIHNNFTSTIKKIWFWIYLSAAYPNLLGTKGYVVVVVVWIYLSAVISTFEKQAGKKSET
jgi:hypothetical protein